MTANSAEPRTAAGQPLPGRAAGRRPELDVMRAFVVAGLVVFHSAVVFAAGTSWFVKDPRPSIGFTVFLLWGSLWSSAVSGTPPAFPQRTVVALPRRRSGRPVRPR